MSIRDREYIDPVLRGWDETGVVQLGQNVKSLIWYKISSDTTAMHTVRAASISLFLLSMLFLLLFKSFKRAD